MPMIPSPAAALVYGAVKIVGYSLFAKGLNRWARPPARPVLFGLGKTVLGLVGGLLYYFAILFLPFKPLEHASDAALFMGAIPIRLVVWSIALRLFYGGRLPPRTMLLAAVAGTAWSYVLDGIMSLLSRVLPGMVTPFC